MRRFLSLVNRSRAAVVGLVVGGVASASFATLPGIDPITLPFDLSSVASEVISILVVSFLSLAVFFIGWRIAVKLFYWVTSWQTH